MSHITATDVTNVTERRENLSQQDGLGQVTRRKTSVKNVALS
jgi:hypothetical protein